MEAAKAPTGAAASSKDLRPGLGGPLQPVPPTTPKPSHTVSLRQRFANHSIGSLPTTSGTRDHFNEYALEDPGDQSSESSDDSSESGLSDDSVSEYGPEEDMRKNAKTARLAAASGGNGSPGAASTQPSHETHDLPSLCDFDGSSSEAPTNEAPRSTWSSQQHPGDADDLDDDFTSEQPVLELHSGVRPPHELPRCPPKSWLAAAGFEVPTNSAGFDGVPVAPGAGERPTRYLDLFCRQVLARQQTSELTAAALARHNMAAGRARHDDAWPPLPDGGHARPGEALEVFTEDGAWLEGFVARARAAPLLEVAASLIGSDVGHAVAGFLDHLSDASSAGASMDARDVPDGLNVRGRRLFRRPLFQGRGRAGFYTDSDAGISTPGRSQSPPPGRSPPPLPLDPPCAPLISVLDPAASPSEPSGC